MLFEDNISIIMGLTVGSILRSPRQITLEDLPNPTPQSLTFSTCVSLQWPSIFSSLSSRQSLLHLTLQNCSIADPQLKLLSSISSIQTLDLSDNPQISDIGIRDIVQMPNLRALVMRGECQVGNEGFRAILKKKLQIVQITLPNIRSLDVQRTMIGDPGALQISKCLPNLTSLMMQNCRITNEGITAIVRSLPLKYLFAENNRLGDEAAMAIAGNLRQVRSLSLDGNQIGEVGAMRIGVAMKSLEYLCLKGNNIPQFTLTQLSRLLPKTQIISI